MSSFSKSDKYLRGGSLSFCFVMTVSVWPYAGSTDNAKEAVRHNKRYLIWRQMEKTAMEADVVIISNNKCLISMGYNFYYQI